MIPKNLSSAELSILSVGAAIIGLFAPRLFGWTSPRTAREDWFVYIATIIFSVLVAAFIKIAALFATMFVVPGVNYLCRKMGCSTDIDAYTLVQIFGFCGFSASIVAYLTAEKRKEMEGYIKELEWQRMQYEKLLEKKSS